MEEMSEDDFIHIYNKLLIPNYQGLVPFDVKLAVKLSYEYGYKKAQEHFNPFTGCKCKLYEETARKNLEEEIRKLRFMIDNGLGWEDLKNDIKMHDN